MGTSDLIPLVLIRSTKDQGAGTLIKPCYGWMIHTWALIAKKLHIPHWFITARAKDGWILRNLVPKEESPMYTIILKAPHWEVPHERK